MRELTATQGTRGPERVAGPHELAGVAHAAEIKPRIALPGGGEWRSMDPSIRVPGTPASEAAEFVRFCRARRRVGWPELYDEMWVVAGRRLFRGYGLAELGELGIGFSLYETTRLAAIVGAVIADEPQAVRRVASTARRGVAIAATVEEAVPATA